MGFQGQVSVELRLELVVSRFGGRGDLGVFLSKKGSRRGIDQVADANGALAWSIRKAQLHMYLTTVLLVARLGR